MAKKQQNGWVYSPGKSQSPKVPETLKAEVLRKARELVWTVLKSRYVLPAPENPQINYIDEIYTRWYRQYFYFCAKHRIPGPYILKPHFESKFARLEYTGNGRFNLSFQRYKGHWVTIYTDLSVDECLTAVKDDPRLTAS